MMDDTLTTNTSLTEESKEEIREKKLMTQSYCTEEGRLKTFDKWPFFSEPAKCTAEAVKKKKTANNNNNIKKKT